MRRNERILAVLLAVAAVLVVVGVAQLHQPAAWMAGGVLTAGWGWVTFSEVDGR